MNQSYKCRMDDSVDTKYKVAMGYVPWQRFTRAYDPQKALNAGTIFPELDKPFWGTGGKGK